MRPKRHGSTTVATCWAKTPPYALASSPSDRAPQVWQLPIALAGEPPQTLEEGGAATINAGGSLSLNLPGPASLEATRTLEATRDARA